MRIHRHRGVRIWQGNLLGDSRVTCLRDSLTDLPNLPFLTPPWRVNTVIPTLSVAQGNSRMRSYLFKALDVTGLIT